MSRPLLRSDIPSATTDITPGAFKAAFRTHAAGVAVITADDGTGPVGMTATSVSSVSAEPPLLVFSASSTASATATIRRAESVVVHLLAADDLHLAALCATSGIDRFADTSIWSRLDSGEPYFPSAQAWLRAEIVERLEVGSSTIVIARATESSVDRASAGPLVYHDRTWHRLDEASALPE